MEYQISDRAKKVTLGIVVIGLIMVILGFFQQKDYVYAEVIDEHSIIVKYNGDASVEMQGELKNRMNEIMNQKGFSLKFHGEGHNGHLENHIDSHEKEHHEASHHGPTFEWDIHISHLDEDSHNSYHEHSQSSSEILAGMIESGEISFFDTDYRRFWSNLLVNGFFFFGIALGALFYLALHYATESGWGVVLLRIFEGIMSAMPIGLVVLLIVFIAGSFGAHNIYPWMDEGVVASDDIIWAKSAYLNKPFFWIRVIIYFGTFYIFMKWFKKKSRLEDEEGGTITHFKMYRRGALFLVFFAVFSSTMSWDFLMSIDTHWYSTLFGWYIFSGIWLSGMVMVCS